MSDFKTNFILSAIFEGINIAKINYQIILNQRLEFDSEFNNYENLEEFLSEGLIESLILEQTPQQQKSLLQKTPEEFEKTNKNPVLNTLMNSFLMNPFYSASGGMAATYGLSNLLSHAGNVLKLSPTAISGLQSGALAIGSLATLTALALSLYKHLNRPEKVIDAIAKTKIKLKQAQQQGNLRLIRKYQNRLAILNRKLELLREKYKTMAQITK